MVTNSLWERFARRAHQPSLDDDRDTQLVVEEVWRLTYDFFPWQQELT